ncbi:MAG: MarR family transcriptional regulator [Burkholderiaceae bacterium]
MNARDKLLSQTEIGRGTRYDLANRLFFRLYQSANMLHKTGTRAVESEGLTTQQWAVLGALSRPSAATGLGVGELARYLMVSRQNLAGVTERLARAGHVRVSVDTNDRRSRRISLTPDGRRVWDQRARPLIAAYYERALADFSIDDRARMLHYLLKLLENFERIDAEPEHD